MISSAHFVAKIPVCAIHMVRPSSLPGTYEAPPNCLGSLSTIKRDSWHTVTWVTIHTNQNYVVWNIKYAMPCSLKRFARPLLLQVWPCEALEQLWRMITFIDSLWTDRRAKSDKSLVMDSSVYKWKKKKLRKLFLLDFRTAKRILNIVGFFVCLKN